MGAGGRFKRASVGRSNEMEGGACMALFLGLVAAVIWGLVEAVCRMGASVGSLEAS